MPIVAPVLISLGFRASRPNSSIAAETLAIIGSVQTIHAAGLATDKGAVRHEESRGQIDGTAQSHCRLFPVIRRRYQMDHQNQEDYPDVVEISVR